MASPNVLNLAAKLDALNLSLTPQQTIALMRKGATPSADGRLHVIDPKATVALLQAKDQALRANGREAQRGSGCASGDQRRDSQAKLSVVHCGQPQ